MRDVWLTNESLIDRVCQRCRSDKRSCRDQRSKMVRHSVCLRPFVCCHLSCKDLMEILLILYWSSLRVVRPTSDLFPLFIAYRIVSMEYRASIDHRLIHDAEITASPGSDTILGRCWFKFILPMQAPNMKWKDAHPLKCFGLVLSMSHFVAIQLRLS
jgi:hypothetical protein